MCGRFTLSASPDEIAALLELEQIDPFPPRYNIAPTQPILVISAALDGRRKGQLVRWGLIPSWVQDPGKFSLLINARSESAAEKPSFRNAMRHRRVLVPATGFYEWHRPPDRKAHRQPYLIRPRSGEIVMFGGLMESWHASDGSEIDTGCLLTTAANASISAIHDRIPVVIKPQDFVRWLDCSNGEPRDVEDLLAPVENEYFEAVAISDKVNKTTNMGPDILEPVAAVEEGQASSEMVRDHNPDQAELF